MVRGSQNKRNVNTKQQRRLLLTSQFALIVIDRSIRRCKLTKNWFLDLPILRDKNYQQLNGRIRSFTVLSWYCKTFIDDAHALFRDSDYSNMLLIAYAHYFLFYILLDSLGVID
jgi:hypothetical protein